MYYFQQTGDERQDGMNYKVALGQLDQLERCEAWGEFQKFLDAMIADAESGMSKAVTGDTALKAATGFMTLKTVRSHVAVTRRNLEQGLQVLQANKMR